MVRLSDIKLDPKRRGRRLEFSKSGQESMGKATGSISAKPKPKRKLKRPPVAPMNAIKKRGLF